MENNTLYLQCYSGISGDMVVAALLDLGAQEEVLVKGLASLNVQGFKINILKTIKCGIVAKKFDVILDQEHHHDHKNYGQSDTHHHGYRYLKDIEEIIYKSNITEKAKKIATKIFQLVAQAEAKVHGKSTEEVHFHEVGAIDSIVDIVATAICIDNLNINDTIISSIYEGIGHVKCQHGIIPVPVPAVVEIATKHRLPIKITENVGEMITPTGIAIAAVLKTKEYLPENTIFTKTGIGAGTKDFSSANILRAFIIKNYEQANTNCQRAVETTMPSTMNDTVMILECNVDDMTGEELGFALDILLDEGALDVYFTPIYMKKNRPAYMFSVICKNEDSNKMKRLLFQHTSTLGIRLRNNQRSVMNRTFQRFNSSLGEVCIKEASYEDITKKTIEYEDIKRIAKLKKISINEVFKQIYSELYQ